MEFKNSDLEYLAIADIRITPDDPVSTKQDQLEKWANVIQGMDVAPPLLVNNSKELLAGHTLFGAYKLLGIDPVPAVKLDRLSPEDSMAFKIAHTKIERETSFDPVRLRENLQHLISVDYNLDLTGMTSIDIDSAFSFDDDTDLEPEVDPIPGLIPVEQATSNEGDLFQCGDHRLICGNSRLEKTYQRLMEDERADAVLTDPPYGCQIEGFVSKSHRNFLDGCFKNLKDFNKFLGETTSHIPAYSKPESLSAVFMDWRGLRSLLNIGDKVFSGLVNVCTWAKTTPSMGSPWRSQTEFSAIFKNGDAQHQDRIQLGRHGRNRSNLWRFPGCSSFGKTRQKDIQDHPTIKPQALLRPLVRDLSNRGDILLDPFGGSGSTMIACEWTGRKARLIELDPKFVDVAIKRWQAETGKEAVHVETGLTFSELAEKRASEAEPKPDTSISEQADEEVAS